MTKIIYKKDTVNLVVIETTDNTYRYDSNFDQGIPETVLTAHDIEIQDRFIRDGMCIDIYYYTNDQKKSVAYQAIINPSSVLVINK